MNDAGSDDNVVVDFVDKAVEAVETPAKSSPAKQGRGSRGRSGKPPSSKGERKGSGGSAWKVTPQKSTVDGDKSGRGKGPKDSKNSKKSSKK